MPQKRLFIAVDISEESRRLASDHVDYLGREFASVRVGWERPEKLHLTLKFLGDVEGECIDSIRNALSAAGGLPAFPLEIARTGVFPNARAPRILWLGVERSTELQRLAKTVEDGLLPLGFEYEKRDFKPHITIGRIREPHNSAELAARHLARPFDSPTFLVDHISIYESTLLPTGSTYSVLSRHKLEE